MPIFDPSEVKCGNLKDPAKIAEKVEEARNSHQADWLDKAALKPETANLLAVGLYHNDKGVEILHIGNCGGEKELLETFWERFNKGLKDTGRPWGTWNGFSFDFPFLILRSRILGVPVPGGLRKGRYFDGSRMLDLREDWLCGRDWREFKSSLDYVSKVFGLPGKNGDGKNFGATYSADRSAAIQYLLSDMWLLKGIAEKLGYDMRPSYETFAEFSAKYLQAQPPEKELARAAAKADDEELF